MIFKTITHFLSPFFYSTAGSVLFLTTCYTQLAPINNLPQASSVMKRIHLLLFFALLLTSVSCIKENLGNCGRSMHYLTFEYSHNAEGVDKFATQVSQIDVYAFDKNGVLVGHFTDQGVHLGLAGYRLPISLSPGDYTLVAWGGVREEYVLSDASNQSGAPLQIQSTRDKDARLSISTLKAMGNSPADLFHGIVYHVPMGTDVTHTHIPLVKNTHTLHVTVRGVNHLRKNHELNDLEMSCRANNGIYNFDNSISENQKLITYIPINETSTSETVSYQIKTLRLLKGINATLSWRDQANGQTVFSKDLMQMLLQLPHVSTNNDLDRYEDYHIDITLDMNLKMTISINGYNVVSNEVDVQ